MELSRRTLLARTGLSAAGALALGARAAARTTASAPPRPGSDPLFRISLAQWSLHRTIRAGKLENVDFAAFARSEFGLDAVEYVNQFFADKAGDFRYLGEMKRRADDAGVRSLLIMVDGEGALADADEAARRRAIENHFKWIAAAACLGCHSIRVNADGAGTRAEMRARAVDSLLRLAELAQPYGLSILVENHGGLSSDGAWLASVMQAADHPRVGTLPDFGNFLVADDLYYDRYRGVKELLPYAKAVSAKAHEFDEAGEEVHTQFGRMLALVVHAGYSGYVGIEYEGDALPEVEGIRRTQRLLERVREELDA